MQVEVAPDAYAALMNSGESFLALFTSLETR
jgi:hypothetical protein